MQTAEPARVTFHEVSAEVLGATLKRNRKALIALAVTLAAGAVLAAVSAGNLLLVFLAGVVVSLAAAGLAVTVFDRRQLHSIRRRKTLVMTDGDGIGICGTWVPWPKVLSLHLEHDELDDPPELSARLTVHTLGRKFRTPRLERCMTEADIDEVIWDIEARAVEHYIRMIDDRDQ